MAVISPVFERDQPGKTHRVTWPNLANGDSGAPISIPGASDYTVQVTGTFGTGGSVLLEGSLEAIAATYFGLRNPQGGSLVFTSADGEMVSELVTHLRPRVTAGDSSTDLTVILLMKSTL